VKNAAKYNSDVSFVICSVANLEYLAIFYFVDESILVIFEKPG